MKNNQPDQYNRVIPVLAVALMTGLGCKTTTSQPYLTTQSPMTLVSSNDGEYNQLFQLTDDQTTDWELKTKDSFTVIHLGPDHPPIIKTVYDTVPCTIYGTPTMAMSSDGRYALIALTHNRHTEPQAPDIGDWLENTSSRVFTQPGPYRHRRCAREFVTAYRLTPFRYRKRQRHRRCQLGRTA